MEFLFQVGWPEIGTDFDQSGLFFPEAAQAAVYAESILVEAAQVLGNAGTLLSDTANEDDDFREIYLIETPHDLAHGNASGVAHVDRLEFAFGSQIHYLQELSRTIEKVLEFAGRNALGHRR
jgi:hypothetical protein